MVLSRKSYEQRSSPQSVRCVRNLNSSIQFVWQSKRDHSPSDNPKEKIINLFIRRQSRNFANNLFKESCTIQHALWTLSDTWSIHPWHHEQASLLLQILELFQKQFFNRTAGTIWEGLSKADPQLTQVPAKLNRVQSDPALYWPDWENKHPLCCRDMILLLQSWLLRRWWDPHVVNVTSVN